MLTEFCRAGGNRPAGPANTSLNIGRWEPALQRYVYMPFTQLDAVHPIGEELERAVKFAWLSVSNRVGAGSLVDDVDSAMSLEEIVAEIAEQNVVAGKAAAAKRVSNPWRTVTCN